MIRRNSLRRVLSSFHRIIALRNFLAIAAISISLNSCYNEPELLGGNLLPADDLTAVKIDTITKISVYTVKPDSLKTYGFSYGVLGCLNSKIFGKTKADFLTQVYLGKTRGSSPLFGSKASLDSLVLYFRLHDKYGTNQALGINLYELKDTMSSYTTYNGLNVSVDNWYEPTKLYSGTYAGDSILRIKFLKDDPFALKIFHADHDSATVSSDKNFKNYFKGFYLTCEDIVNKDNSGVMYSFDFKSTETTMYLYYHRNDSALVYSFILGSQTYVTPRFNHIIHDYSQADPAYAMKHVNDTLTQDTVFYAEGLGGARGLIKFEGIDEWVEKVQKPIAINRAELRLEQENYPNGLPKDSLSYLYYFADETSTGTILTEDQKIAASEQVSTYAKYNIAKKYYSINLTEHIQAIVTGKISKKSMYVLPLNSPYSAARNVLRSGNNKRKIKLIITYSKL